MQAVNNRSEPGSEPEEGEKLFESSPVNPKVSLWVDTHFNYFSAASQNLMVTYCFPCLPVSTCCLVQKVWF